ncbi:Transposase [Polaromonas sp. OV174]|nr:Transposase [Polaromonas sp. OV174]
MKRVRYPAEFKAEVIKQVTERGHGVVDVAKRLGMSDKSLYFGRDLPRSTGLYEASWLRRVGFVRPNGIARGWR